MGSIVLLILLGKLKTSNLFSCLRRNKILNKLIWFLGTAKAAIVCLLMMLIAWLVESDQAVQNFVEKGCLSNDRDANGTIDINNKKGLNILEGQILRDQILRARFRAIEAPNKGDN